VVIAANGAQPVKINLLGFAHYYQNFVLDMSLAPTYACGHPDSARDAAALHQAFAEFVVSALPNFFV